MFDWLRIVVDSLKDNRIKDAIEAYGADTCERCAEQRRRNNARDADFFGGVERDAQRRCAGCGNFPRTPLPAGTYYFLLTTVLIAAAMGPVLLIWYIWESWASLS
jgi:hypothetical protein